MTDLAEMWAALESHQPIADKKGYGEAWKRMCTERTEEAAVAAADDAANDAAVAASRAAIWAKNAIECITRANEEAAK